MILFFIFGCVFLYDPSAVLSIFSVAAVAVLFVAQFIVYFTAALMFSHKENRMPGANVLMRVHCSAMIAFSLINLFLMIIGMAQL